MYTGNFLLYALFAVGLSEMLFNVAAYKGDEWVFRTNSENLVFIIAFLTSYLILLLFLFIFLQDTHLGFFTVCEVNKVCIKHTIQSIVPTVFGMCIVFQIFGLIILFFMLVSHFFLNSLLEDWNLHGTLLTSSALIFSITTYVQIGTTFHFLTSNKLNGYEITSKSTSFHYFMISVFLSQIKVALAFFTVSFSSRENSILKGDGFDQTADEKDLKIKSKCVKIKNETIDIRTAPSSTPQQSRKHEEKHPKSHRNHRDRY
jgi:hypothetical protein